MPNVLFYVKEPAPTFPLSYDYTTFTEVDENSDITISSSSVIAFDTMRRDASSGVYRDDGADAYNGDFEFQFKWDWTASTGTPASMTMFCLSENFYLTKTERDSANDGLNLAYRHGVGFQLQDLKGNDEATKGIASGPPKTRWLDLNRTGTTVTLTLWTDANRTTEDSGSPISITQPSAYSYRWIYAMTSLNSSTSGDRAITGTVEDLVRIS